MDAEMDEMDAEMELRFQEHSEPRTAAFLGGNPVF
jgi:hypothetical protein